MELTQLNPPATKAATHAPGFTWKWTGSSDSDYIEVRTRLGSLFARLPSVNRATMVKSERSSYEANARLIASARELLDTLQEITEACNQLPASDGRAIGLIPLIVRAEAAIAKATT